MAVEVFCVGQSDSRGVHADGVHGVVDAAGCRAVVYVDTGHFHDVCGEQFHSVVGSVARGVPIWAEFADSCGVCDCGRVHVLLCGHGHSHWHGAGRERGTTRLSAWLALAFAGRRVARFAFG